MDLPDIMSRKTLSLISSVVLFTGLAALLLVRLFDAHILIWVGAALLLIGLIITNTGMSSARRLQTKAARLKSITTAAELVLNVKYAVDDFLRFDPMDDAVSLSRDAARQKIGKTAKVARAMLRKARFDDASVSRSAARFDALTEEIDGMFGRNQDTLARLNATRRAKSILKAAEDSLSDLLDDRSIG